MSDEVVLSLRALRRSFGDRVAVDGLSLEVRRGEMFGLIGPDGAGKTTTIRLVLGLLRPTQGSVLTLGLDPIARRREIAERVGYLSQRFSIYGDLSADENVAFFAEVHGVRGWRARRDELLEWLRLAPFRDRLADRLSGGMRQKLALACTLIHTPELLVLDEPTTGVDPVSRRDFWRVLSRLQREGMTILVTTPYLDEAERCQRVALVAHGRLLRLDTADGLRSGAGGPVLEVLAQPRAAARRVLESAAWIGDVEVFGERLHATLTPSTESDSSVVARTRQALESEGVSIESIRAVEPSLEDVFIAALREGA